MKEDNYVNADKSLQIRIKRKTWKRLVFLKAETGLKSFDKVINFAIDEARKKIE